jgi:uncharacterized protein with beta-barrel porin domain
MAGLLLPGTAHAQAMRDAQFGPFAGESFGPPGPNGPPNGYMFGPMQAPPFGGAPFAPFGSGTGGMMQPNAGWSADPQRGIAGGPRFDEQQAFGGSVALSQAETAQATFLAMTQFTQTLLDPAIDGRGDAPAEFDAELAAYASMGNDPTHGGVGREAYEAFYGKPSLAAPHWSVWATGFGGSQVSTGSAVPGSSSATRSFGTVIGADYSLSPQTRIGFALAGGGTSFSDNFSSGRSDLFQAGAFVRRNAGPAYVAGALSYGWQAVTNDHPATPAGSDRSNAAFNANAYSGRIESGYRFVTPWLGLTPYAAAQFTTASLPANAGQPPSYATNAFAAAFGGDSVTDGRGELGLRTSSSFALERSVLNLRGRLAWAHDFSAARSIPAAFQALPGLGFAVSGAALAPDSALAGVSLELRGINGWFAAATFDGELSSLVRSYTGKAVLRYLW